MPARGVTWLLTGGALALIVGAFIYGITSRAPDYFNASRPTIAAAPIPVAPRTVSPPAAATLPMPSFDIVSVDPRGQAVIAGRAAPGDRVTVLDGDKRLGEVTADARGEWVLVPEAPIGAGNRQLSLEATTPNGGAPRRSADVVALSINPAGPGNDEKRALAVLLPGEPGKPARILQSGEAGEQARQLSLESVERGAGRLIVSGHASPGARVKAYLGDHGLGTATADSSGAWSLSSRRSAEGDDLLRLEELGGDGHVVRQVSTRLSMAPPAAGSPTTYVVERGNSLWLIARRLYGEGLRFTMIYQANRDQIRDPDRIYPGQQFKLPPS